MKEAMNPSPESVVDPGVKWSLPDMGKLVEARLLASLSFR